MFVATLLLVSCAKSTPSAPTSESLEATAEADTELPVYDGQPEEVASDVETEGSAPVYDGEVDDSSVPRPTPTASVENLREQASSLVLAGYTDSWQDFLDFRGQYGPFDYPAHMVDFDRRVTVHVQTPAGNPVSGARVRVYDAQQQAVITGRTYATGNFPVYVKNGTQYVVEVGQEGVPLMRRDTLTFEQRGAPTKKVDVVFAIDTTGSMQDEIDALKNNIVNVARLLGEEFDVQYAFTAYRDIGDDYVTKSGTLGDVHHFVAEFTDIRAAGGGDYPESLSTGLSEAVNGHQWRTDAVRIVILIADAPPQTNAYYADAVIPAWQKGVKIMSVAASGLDSQTGEYVFRQVAALTEGAFVFLTYDDAQTQAEPGTETSHHVDEYTVGRLDVLLVRLIEDEMSYQAWDGQW